jgi:hypothetical protein
MRQLILRQCALFLVAYLKREDDEPEGVLCLTLDAADEVWSVLDERPTLLRQFISYLRISTGDSANARLVTEFRIAVLGILTQLVSRVREQPNADRKFGALLNAGLYPTLLWIRRRWRSHDALFSATLVLEHALFDAYELAIGRAFKPVSAAAAAAAAAAAGGSVHTNATSATTAQRVPLLVSLDAPVDAAAAAAAAPTPAPATKNEEGRKTKRRTKTVRVQLNVASHVGYFSLPHSSSATVDSLKRAALRASAALLVTERVHKGATASSTTTSSSSSVSDDEVTDAAAARYCLALKVSGAPLDDGAKLGDVGVEVDALLYLRGKPSTVRVVSIIQGKEEQLDLTYDALDFETVASVRASCAQSINHPLADQCRIYVPTSAGGAVYEVCESSRSLGSLPEGVPLHFKLPPRQLKVAFKDGTFAFVSVAEAMPVAQLLTQLAKKRSISTNRLQDYGVFVDDESAANGGFWVDDDSDSNKKRTVTYLFEHSDELTVRFVPRAHPVRLTLELSDTDNTLRRGRVLELYFDVPVSQSIISICETLSLKQPPLELALMHKKKKQKTNAPAAAAKRDDPTTSTADDSSSVVSTDVGSSRDPSDTPRELEEELLLGWVPLRAQGVQQNDSLVLRLRTNTAAANPTRIDIWKRRGDGRDGALWRRGRPRAQQAADHVRRRSIGSSSYLTSDSAHDIGFANTFMILASARLRHPSEIREQVCRALSTCRRCTTRMRRLLYRCACVSR